MMARVRLRVEVYATVRDVYAMHNGITAADGSSGEFEEWWAVSHRPTGFMLATYLSQAVAEELLAACAEEMPGWRADVAFGAAPPREELLGIIKRITRSTT